MAYGYFGVYPSGFYFIFSQYVFHMQFLGKNLFTKVISYLIYTSTIWHVRSSFTLFRKEIMEL